MMRRKYVLKLTNTVALALLAGVFAGSVFVSGLEAQSTAGRENNAAVSAVLVIPSLEKVGQLRQSSTPIAGKNFWMAFSNPRLTVKPGDRVNIVIGPFHAEGLVVE
jgi:hypothetical protein